MENQSNIAKGSAIIEYRSIQKIRDYPDLYYDGMSLALNNTTKAVAVGAAFINEPISNT
jgi:hypothetical protein